MKSGLLWSLVILNAMLLGWHFARPNPATAQVVRPADYVLIPGEVNGGQAEFVYILDTTNNQLSAVSYDDPTRRIQRMMAPIGLDSVFKVGQAPANGQPRGAMGGGR